MIGRLNLFSKWGCNLHARLNPSLERPQDFPWTPERHSYVARGHAFYGLITTISHEDRSASAHTQVVDFAALKIVLGILILTVEQEYLAPTLVATAGAVLKADLAVWAVDYFSVVSLG